MINQLKSLWEWRELSMLLAVYAMKNEKRTHVFGDAWFILNPLFQVCIFYVLMTFILRRPIENFPLFFCCGFFAFQLFMKSLGHGPTLFVRNAAIIKTASFPRIVIIAPVIIRALYELGIELLLLLGLMLLYGVWPNSQVLYFPLFLVITILGMAGMLMLLSIVGSRFKDVINFMEHLKRVLFYGSPVMYSLSFVPEHLHGFYFLNPIAVGIEITRYCWIRGEGVSLLQFMYYGLFCVSLFVIGLYIFKKHERKVSKYV